MDDTAVLITAFLRDNLLFRCIKSIRKFYPEIPIFIGDNGKPSKKKDVFCSEYDCTHFELPFDLGVAGVRNESLKRIPSKYKYIMVCEDDVIFTTETKLETLRAIIGSDKRIGIAGGLIWLTSKKEQHYEGTIELDGENFNIKRIDNPDWKKIGDTKFYYCDLILNIFMMRRAVWDDIKWDEKFKTVLEHEDFYLSLKYDPKTRTLKKNPWRVTFTTDVSMYHKPAENEEYLRYRRRPSGWVLFSKKWKVKYNYSDYNPGTDDPIVYATMGTIKYNNIDEVLEKAIRILEGCKIKWWLEAETCLDVVRDGKLSEKTPSIDIGIAPNFSQLWDTLIERFKKGGFTVSDEWYHGKKKIKLGFKYADNTKLNLYFFQEAKQLWWHGYYFLNSSGKPDKKRFLPHVFPKKLFRNPEEKFFRGKR